MASERPVMSGEGYSFSIVETKAPNIIVWVWYTWGNQDSERFSDLSEATQLGRDISQAQTISVLFLLYTHAHV